MIDIHIPDSLIFTERNICLGLRKKFSSPIGLKKKNYLDYSKIPWKQRKEKGKHPSELSPLKGSLLSAPKCLSFRSFSFLHILFCKLVAFLFSLKGSLCRLFSHGANHQKRYGEMALNRGRYLCSQPVVCAFRSDLGNDSASLNLLDHYCTVCVVHIKTYLIFVKEILHNLRIKYSF